MMSRLHSQFTFILCSLCATTADAFVRHQPVSVWNRVQWTPAGGSGTSLHVIDFNHLAGLFGTMPDPQSSLESTGALIAQVAQREGPLAMVLAVAISDSVPLVPTQPISIIAGAVFGLQLGLPAVMLGQVLATLFAIGVGRFVIAQRRDLQSALAAETADEGNKMTKVLDELTSGLNSDDWKTVFGTILLARQSPVLPFSLGNYFIGASTKAPIVPALAATVVGCLPLNLLWVGAGAGGTAALEAVQANGLLAEGLEAVGLLATAAIVLSIGKVVLKVFNEEEASVSS